MPGAGKVVDTVLLHGRGQCVLQLASTEEATAFLAYYADRPLVLNGKKVLCQRGATDISRTPIVVHRHILREVHHVRRPTIPIQVFFHRIVCGATSLPDGLIQETVQVLDDIIRKLVQAEAAENRRNRHKRQKRHRKLLKEQRLASRGLLYDSEAANVSGTPNDTAAERDQIRHDVCWDFVKTGGKCYRGTACQYAHEMVPLHQIPVKLRL